MLMVVRKHKRKYEEFLLKKTHHIKRRYKNIRYTTIKQ